MVAPYALPGVMVFRKSGFGYFSLDGSQLITGLSREWELKGFMQIGGRQELFD